MSDIFSKIIASELQLPLTGVKNTIALLLEGATVPFISRYRKELTGSLDEVAVENIKIGYDRLVEIDKRKQTILKSIEEQEKLTPELRKKIEECYNANDLEDIYLPYKQKRKTRASKAKELGLEPLAQIILRQTEQDIISKARTFIKEGVDCVDDALAGARDIIAEMVNESQPTRNQVRYGFQKDAVITAKLVKGKETEGEKYKDYFEFSEQLKKCPSHRLLAIMRGEKEGFLKFSISPTKEPIIESIKRHYIKSKGDCASLLEEAIEDAYSRLLEPSIETEFSNLSKRRADEEAIRVFTSNLRQLLLGAPLGQKNVLAIDPGFRTGCKVVCLDAQGNLVHNETIYPHQPQNEVSQSIKKISTLVESYKIEAIAIGNGTAGRETEEFIKKVPFNRDLNVFSVSEDGASIYSASPVAREEFPNYDVTVRGAVSIGRRLMDPLSELVKIDAKSIGVGQYQHDVDQSLLKSSLDSVVESCVNSVGVNINTASKHLLTYVSGLGPQLAQNIVDFRKENGPFATRDQLKKVPRLGAKAYEQSAGFLRIPDAKNPLDNSAVHPEAYSIVMQMSKDANCTVEELISSEQNRKSINISQYVTPTLGIPTLTDILKELEKPGRDPRKPIKVFEFSAEIKTISDLKIGMIIPGIVTNITNFGCFVDVGVKQDGLVHISQLADKFVADPNEVVKLHQHVKVKVTEVDTVRKRIALSMKEG